MILEGCRVSQMREGPSVETGTLRIWPQVGRAAGAQAISLRVLEFASGVSPGMRNETCDEILYVLDADWNYRNYRNYRDDWDRGRLARLNERGHSSQH